MLTPAEIAAFKRDGFVVKPNLVSREVCERCLDVAWGLAPPPVTSVTSRHDQESWIDPGIRGAWPQLARDEATGRRAMPQGCWYERHNTIKFVQDDSGRGAGTDPTVLSLFNSGPVQDVVAQLIGTPVKHAESCKGIYFIFPTRQDEGHHLELALHRDIQPFQVSAVVYLADTPPGAGGITVVPGSHVSGYHAFEHEYHFEPRDAKESYNGSKADLELTPVETTGEAGSVVFYHHRLLHSFGINRSGFSEQPVIRQAALCDFMRSDRPMRDDFVLEGSKCSRSLCVFVQA